MKKIRKYNLKIDGYCSRLNATDEKTRKYTRECDGETKVFIELGELEKLLEKEDMLPLVKKIIRDDKKND